MAKKLYPEEAVQDIADSIRRINGSSDNYKISQMSGAIDDFDEEFARVDGYYENLTAGNAEQLLATKFTEDKTPYLFRSTGGTADVGNREYDTIIGGSVVFSQLVDDSDFVSTGGIISTEDGVGSFTANAQNQQVYKSFQAIANHVYVGAVTYKTTTATSDVCGRMFGYDFDGITSTNWQTLMCIKLQLINSGVSIGVKDKRTSNWDEIKVKNYMAIDLTQMFGSTIADYAYQLEQATAGSGIAWLKSQGFLTEDYIPFNEGEIKSVSGLVSHDMVGFNQWDEEWENGGIGNSSGEDYESALTIRSKNYIPVFPNTIYYAKSGVSANIFLRYYREDKSYISGLGQSANGTFTTPSDCHYLRFYMADTYGTTYNQDICINLSWSGYRNGEYEPYVKHSYPLDNTLTLRGIPKISDGKLYYDGDVYNSDGSVVRKYGVVDLGSLTYTYNESSLIGVPCFYATIPSIKTGSNKNLSSAFENKADRTYINGNGQMAIGNTISANYIVFRDDAYSDATAFKAAMSGVMLVYEKATPTTSQAEPFTNPQTCDDFGTEEYVTDGIPVGHETRYPANLRDKLQHLPNLANADGDYVIRQSNNDMILVPIPTTTEELPDAPTTDGNYVLKCSVADGEVTYTWESEE